MIWQFTAKTLMEFVHVNACTSFITFNKRKSGNLLFPVELRKEVVKQGLFFAVLFLWFFRVMVMSICDPNDREKSFGAPDVQITPLSALIWPSAQTIFLSRQPQDSGLF
jgi:hypothetical protein